MPHELCLLARPCQSLGCCGTGAGYHPPIHSLVCRKHTGPIPFPTSFCWFCTTPRGYFFCSNHFELPLSELADSLHLWNSGSEICIQGAKNGGPFVHETPKTPYCSGLSLSVVFPVPWPPVHGPKLPHVHTVNTGATESCPLLRTPCDSGWESSAHCQPRH